MIDLKLEADYSTREVAELAGLPYATVDRWHRAGIITATTPATGYGSKRRWSSADVDRLMRIGDVHRAARAQGLLVTWAAVAAMWDGLFAGVGWTVTLAA